MIDMSSASLMETLLFLKDVMYIWRVASLQSDAYRTATFVIFLIKYMIILQILHYIFVSRMELVHCASIVAVRFGKAQIPLGPVSP